MELWGDNCKNSGELVTNDQLNKTIIPKENATIREQLRSLNTEIKVLQDKVKLCDGIADRSTGIEDFFKKNYEQIKQNEQKKKE